MKLDFKAWLELAFKLAQMGVDAAPMVADSIRIWKTKKDPTKADWDTLHARRDAFEARLKAPE